jgi:uncharacterized membrane protein YkgB
MTKRAIFFVTVVPGIVIFVALFLAANDNTRAGRVAGYFAMVVAASLVSVVVRVITTPGAWNQKLQNRPPQPQLKLRPWVRRLIGRPDSDQS